MKYFVIILYGLLLGSLLNACIGKILKEKSIIATKAHCTIHKKNIEWYALMPVISYLYLNRRYKYFNTRFFIQHLFVELLTALLITFTYHSFGLSFYFFKYAIFICFLMVIAIIDIKTTDVYTITTVPAIIIGLAFTVIESIIYKSSIFTYVGGAVACGLIILIIVYSTSAMGEGDIEIAMLAGLFLGLRLSLLMMMLSFIIGGLIGILLIVLKIKSRKDYIAFGPFIAIASLINIFIGNRIMLFLI